MLKLSKFHLLVCLSLVLCWAEVARAGVFDVNPVKVELTPRKKSQLLTLTNKGDKPIRFILNINAWEEQPDGKMTLVPTKELVVFPTLLELKLGKDRKIRIGTLKPATTKEVTYRLIVEEQPPDPGVNDDKTTINVLTKLSIPIFVVPKKPEPKLSATVKVINGQAQVELTNPGNAHLRVNTIELVGDGVGRPGAFTHQLKGWYLLADGKRVYQVPIPADVCTQLNELRVQIDSTVEPVMSKVAVLPADCS